MTVVSAVLSCINNIGPMIEQLIVSLSTAHFLKSCFSCHDCRTFRNLSILHSLPKTWSRDNIRSETNEFLIWSNFKLNLFVFCHI